MLTILFVFLVGLTLGGCFIGGYNCSDAKLSRLNAAKEKAQAEIDNKVEALKRNFFTTHDFAGLQAPGFDALARETYANFAPARNSDSPNPRGLRWGVFANDEFIWSQRNTYHLGKEVHPEQGDVVRTMDLIPEHFLRRPEIEDFLRESFQVWGFAWDSHEVPFEIQLSALGYVPTLARTATPMPDRPHQDGVDGTIVVLSRENVIGGFSRVWTLDEELVAEIDLEVGQGVSVKDDRVLHSVSNIQLAFGATSGHRHVLVARFRPLTR